jgi:hypothetical protein
LFTQCVHKSAMMDLCCYAVLFINGRRHSRNVGETAAASTPATA